MHQQDAVNITFTLDEPQRVAALAMSNTSGGDGAPILLSMFEDGVFDMANNTNPAQTYRAVTEIADTIPPRPLAANLRLGDGVLTITSSETIDATPQTNFDFSKIFVANETGGAEAGKDVSLYGATGIEMDGVSVTVTVTEWQRTNSIPISGKTGGDGHPAFLVFLPGALQDIGTNVNSAKFSLQLTEIDDDIPPKLIAASIDYNTGLLRFTFTEVVDVFTGQRFPREGASAPDGKEG